MGPHYPAGSQIIFFQKSKPGIDGMGVSTAE